ncbi:MAG: hypothetical protein JW885_12005 [Deltaproteobacteria bacterium]|nr:hypothetical protein [Candidatus Zymogenaceae bacterium]
MSSKKSSNTVRNERGTPLYKLNRLRENVLTSLLDDLVNMKETGLEDDYCKIIDRSLEYTTNFATEIPSSYIRAPLYKHFSNFRETYKKWNDLKGDSKEIVAEREKKLKKLRKIRKKITDSISMRQVELQNNLDEQVLTDIYHSFHLVIVKAPEVFVNLSKALYTIVKKIGKFF